MIILEGGRQRFPERVSDITSPGFLDGHENRREAGLPPESSPSAVVTTLGVFRFAPADREMVLREY